MAIRDTYRRQVALLVRLLPLVAEQSCFALKGGTAINLFIRDMPRLSVDIDLTYLPVEPRFRQNRNVCIQTSGICLASTVNLRRQQRNPARPAAQSRAT